jgi:hypothetical protein
VRRWTSRLANSCAAGSFVSAVRAIRQQRVDESELYLFPRVRVERSVALRVVALDRLDQPALSPREEVALVVGGRDRKPAGDVL